MDAWMDARLDGYMLYSLDFPKHPKRLSQTLTVFYCRLTLPFMAFN